MLTHPRHTPAAPRTRQQGRMFVLAAALLLLAVTPCHAEVPPWMLGDEQTMKCYFLNKTEIATPPHIHLSWSAAPPATMYDDSASNVSYSVEIAPEFWTSPGAASLLQGDLAHWRSLCDGTAPTQCTKSASSNCCVFHSNLHSCRSNTGVCSPWVKPQNCTSGTCEAGMQLVTHTAAQVGGAELYSHGLRLQQGSWVVIAHIKIMNFQCAVGATRTVHQRPAGASAMQWVIPLVIAFVCVIVLVAFTNGYQYTRGQLLTVPLKRLAHRMQLTASLQDDDEDDDTAVMAEVADMQEAYGKMKAELNRMRSFLPQSVLNPAGDDDEEDDEGAIGGEQDEGDVSKSSLFSPDMNRSQASQMSKMSKARSAKSTGSTATKRSKAHGGGLNLSTNVQRKRIAVVVFNTMQFHELVSTQSHAQPKMKSTQERLLKAVLPAITENKGVVDVFNGDHVIVSFNAVNNVGQCSKRAVQAALAVTKTLSGDATMGQLSIGVAAGSACVGNMGIDGMQRFNIVGSVYGEALAMERHARRAFDEGAAAEGARVPWALCATQDALGDVALEYDVEYTDWVRVGAQRAKAVGRVLKAKEVAMDEWMYQVQEGESADPNATANAAFSALVARDFEEVQRFLSVGAVPDAKRARLEAVLAAEMNVSAATVVGFY